MAPDRTEIALMLLVLVLVPALILCIRLSSPSGAPVTLNASRPLRSLSQ